MELGALTTPFSSRERTDAFKILADHGVDAVELSCGGYAGEFHLNRTEYLDDQDAQRRLQRELDEHGLRLSALATHNNPLHPDESRAEEAHNELRETIELADQLDVDTVVTFSGLPAGSPDGVVPNWIVSTWPPEHGEALEYQWDVAIDYWAEIARVAKSHDVEIALELHPNMLIYEPTGLLELRDATNEYIGANLDPSHFYWQQIDVVTAIELLGRENAVHHFHAKDTQLFADEISKKGVLDTTSYLDEAERSWIFRTVGFGHDKSHWRDIVTALRLVGYDGVLSIEHEDSLLSRREGLEYSVEFLNDIILREEAENPWE